MNLWAHVNKVQKLKNPEMTTILSKLFLFLNSTSTLVFLLRGLPESTASVITAPLWAHIFEPHVLKGKEAFFPLITKINPEVNICQNAANVRYILSFYTIFTLKGKPTIKKYSTPLNECFLKYIEKCTNVCNLI